MNYVGFNINIVIIFCFFPYSIGSNVTIVCERQLLNISCAAGVIVVENANYGRTEGYCENSPREVCTPLNVTENIETWCNGRHVCQHDMTDGDLNIANDNCGRTKYLNLTFGCRGDFSRYNISWSNASSNCQEVDGELGDLTFFQTARITEDGFWLKNRWRFTEFFYILSCYKINDAANFPSINVSSTNRIAECDAFCNGTTIGLMDKTCYCISDTRYVSTTLGTCSTRCGDSVMDFCGFSSGVSAYKRLTPADKIPFDNTPDYTTNCVHLHVEKMGKDYKYFWRYDNCDNNALDGYICQIYKSGQNSFKFKAFKGNFKWADSRSNCLWYFDNKTKEFGVDLAFVSNRRDLQIDDIEKNRSYWIGVYRNIYMLDEDEAEENGDVCGTWASASAKVQLTDCEQNATFICVFNPKPSVEMSTILGNRNTTNGNYDMTRRNVTTEHQIIITSERLVSGQSNNSDLQTGLIGLAIAVSVVIVLVIIIVPIGIISYRNRKTRTVRRNQLNSVSNQIYGDDDDVFIMSATDQDVKSSSANTNPPPIKPTRRKSSCRTVSYENVPIGENISLLATNNQSSPNSQQRTVQEIKENNAAPNDEDYPKLKLENHNSYDYIDKAFENSGLGKENRSNEDDNSSTYHVYDYASKEKVGEGTSANSETLCYDVVDSDSEYVTNGESEYDFMRQRRKKKQTSNENLYDHTRQDDEYDQTKNVGKYENDIEYDHMTKAKNNAEIVFEDDNYDTTK